jgi:rubrerythrin
MKALTLGQLNIAKPKPDPYSKDKVCKECGENYQGTASSKYCPVCRAERL